MPHPKATWFPGFSQQPAHALALPWADPAHEPRLRLGAAAGPELAFIPDFRQPIYVRVVRKQNSG